MNFKKKLLNQFKKFSKRKYYILIDKCRYLPHRNYLFTDEKLRFTHILERINYLRVAVNNEKKLLQTYYG